MWAVYPQVASDFIDFVLNQIKGCDFDVCVNDLWGVRAEIESMPGVGTPTEKRFRKCHRMTPFRIALLSNCQPEVEGRIEVYAVC